MHTFRYNDIDFPGQIFTKTFPGKTEAEARKLFEAYLDRLIEMGKIVYEC